MNTVTITTWSDDMNAAPKDISLLLWNDEWMDEDFNPSGVMDGYLDKYYDEMPGGILVVAGWNWRYDTYTSFTAVPTHWAVKTAPNE